MFYQGLKELPNDPFYMIITSESISIPGDERSRTAPGHGYPAHTRTVPSIQQFIDVDEWKTKISDMMFHRAYREEFRAFIVEPVTFVPEINLKMDSDHAI